MGTEAPPSSDHAPQDRPAGLPHPLRIVESPRPGVNFVGLLEAESGLGEVARRVAAVIDASDTPFAAIPYRGSLSRHDYPLALAISQDAPYDINVISLSADHLGAFADAVGGAFFARRYSIGIWFWETTVFSSADRTAARFLDELWVASEYVRDAIVDHVDIPVHVVPVPMEPPAGPFLTRSELGMPDGFTFLFVFDFWSGERKNPTAVVEAFSRAFRAGEGPTLLLKCIHGSDWKPQQLDQLRRAAAGRGDIVIRDGYVSAAERDSLVAASDCYVSLHRSEGLGLTMAEAMALGKPVIATGHSGNLEFMSETNGYLVPFELVGVPDTWWAYAPGAEWAEADVDAAASVMRHVWEHQSDARAVGERAQADVRRNFSAERTAEFIERRLTEARARGAVSARASSHDARPAIVDASQVLAKGTGEALTRRPDSRPTSLARRLLLRALWPYFEDERRFQTSLVDAVTELQRSLDEVERRVLQIEERLSREQAPTETPPPPR